MTTDNTDPVRSALGNILESFRNGGNLSSEDNRPTVAQDRVRAIINSGKEYSVVQVELETERVSLQDRIAYNDSLTGDEDTLERLRETFDMTKAVSIIESELLKPEPFYGETVVEITVPSGKLVIADSLHPVFCAESSISINYARGKHETALQFAKDCNVALAFVGNSCPAITRQKDGSYVVVSLEAGEENKVVFENEEQSVAYVVTDTWSVELTDYQNWLDNGGQELKVGESHGYTVLEVSRGRYRWTVKSHSDDWNYYESPRAEFAKLELVEAF